MRTSSTCACLLPNCKDCYPFGVVVDKKGQDMQTLITLLYERDRRIEELEETIDHLIKIAMMGERMSDLLGRIKFYLGKIPTPCLEEPNEMIRLIMESEKELERQGRRIADLEKLLQKALPESPKLVPLKFQPVCHSDKTR